MKKEDKGQIIAQLAETIQAYPHFYLVDVTALDAAATSELRRKCFKQEVKQGKIDFKVDKSGIVHTSIGKVSFSADAIRENAKEFIATINKLKPSAAKGTYIKSIYLSSTMSRGIKIDPKSCEEN